MSNQVFEDAPQAAPGVADKFRKQARQLAYDVRYKVKGQFKDGQKADPASLKRAYLQQPDGKRHKFCADVETDL